MSFFQQILAFNKPNNSNNEIIIGNHNIDAYNFINLFPNWNNNLVIFQGPYGCGKNRILKFWQNNSSAIQLDLFKNDTKKICQDLEKHMHFFIKDLDHYFNKKYILRNLTLNKF